MATQTAILARAKAVALARFADAGARDARIERGAYGYTPQTRVVTVDVYRTGSLSRTRVVAGTVDDLAKK